MKSNTKNATAVVQNIASAALSIQEEQIDNELQKYDRLLVEDDDTAALEQLRAKRLRELQYASKQRAANIAAGHGIYTELNGNSSNDDVAKEFFHITKQSDRVVIHFYKSSSNHICDYYHKHLNLLAQQHIETRFLKLNVESVTSESIGSTTTNGISYLVEKLHITVMPTIVLIKNRQVVHTIIGYNELIGPYGDLNNIQFTTANLAYVLGKYDILTCTPDEEDAEPDHTTNNGGFNSIRLSKLSIHDKTKNSRTTNNNRRNQAQSYGDDDNDD